MKETNNRWKRLLAFLLAAVLCTAALPVTALAAVGSEEASYVQDENRSKEAIVSLASRDGLTDSTEETSAAITIAAAKASATGTEGITVEGTVTLISGKNVYVQDETGGIVLYFSATPAVSVGDMIRAAGTRASFKGLEELSGVSEAQIIGKAEELPSRTATISEILADQGAGTMESTRILIENAIIGEINTSGNTSLQQGEDSINIYKIPALEGISQGDTVSLYAVLGDYYGYQLLVGAASDVTLASGGTEDPDRYETDTSLVSAIAQWGGGSPYAEGAVSISGDKYEVGDGKDSSAAFKAVVSGSEVQAYTSSTTSTGGTNYYMGGKGLGSGTDDYMQFAVPASGWGDMNLSFRLRVSNTGSGEWQLKYSADGENFENFTAGSYSYTSGTSVLKEGEIGDGVAKTSMNAANYINFSFEVPAEAENAETLYIRLVPSTEVRAKGDGKPGTGGVVRIDTVMLSGSPIVDESITGYVTVTPDGTDEDQTPGTELTMASATDQATVWYRFVNTEDGSGEWQEYDDAQKPVLPEELPAVLEVYATSDNRADSIIRSLNYAAGSVQPVKMSPNGGGVYVSGDSVPVALSCATDGAVIYYSTGTDGSGQDVYAEYTAPILLERGFGTMTIKAYAVREGFKDSAVTTRIFTERSSETYQVYFGQMHAHTSYSDGAGTVEDAYSHASGVDNLDFLAITDHSNSFDNANAATITDGSVSEKWTEGTALAEQYTTDDFVGLFGYEMTWSNGLGHINTFNTGGFQSRTQSDYTTYSTALQNYYASLKTVNDSISQFNHPGTSFGDFSDFAYYDEEIDQLITLIEVGNGEGAIGSSGYFPSYEYYTRALDKGWHVAPTNNQDNHKGRWGDANTARSVVLADSLTKEDIYDAMRNYRVYATEDNDLSIYYTLDGNTMGSILSKEDVGDTVTLSAKLSDPTDSSIGKVEVIVNGGYSLASADVTANEDTVTFTVGADYSYYYIKVTEADGDIAVTAPVWVGSVEAVGVSTFTADAVLAVQNRELNLDLEMYNNEKKDFLIDSIDFEIDGKTVHTADLTGLSKIGAMDTASYTFPYTYSGLGATNITAVITGTLDGVVKIYKAVLQLDYVSEAMVTKVVIDGTHYNDYVTGYYGGNMGNFTTIAAGRSIDVSVVTDEITRETLEDCALLVISAPAKKSGTANAGDYVPSTFEDSFIELVREYVQNGGSVIVGGLADYQDSRSNEEYHSSVQINKLLEAVGSTMSINDDEVYDPVSNGGQFYRLYPSVFNTDSEWTAGIVEGQVYSQYSGCSVNPGEGTWLVKGFDTTYSVDSDKDGRGNTDEIETDDNYGYNIVTPKGEVVFLAAEETAYGGTVFAAGGVFLSDFEVKADVDDYGLAYANRTIAENILDAVTVELPLSTIKEVREAGNAGNRGDVYRVQGYVTAGTAVEENTFFDCIYIQDETGGMDIFPYAEAGLELGTKIEIVGYLADYQGDLELKVMSYKILDEEPHIIEPERMSCADAMDYEKNGGKLIRVQGKVQSGSIAYNSDGTLAQFVVEDEDGGEAKIFIDGYILSAETGKNTLSESITEGSNVSAVGVLYMHPEGNADESVPVLRVRNCDEVLRLEEPETPDKPDKPETPDKPGMPDKPGAPAITKPLQAGAEFASGILKYRVIRAAEGSRIGQVSVRGLAKTGKKISIPAVVTDSVTGEKFNVVSLGKNAFKGNKKLTAVVIGKNVTSVGAKAFEGCTGLKKVTIGKGVCTIGKQAFYRCAKLRRITVKSSALGKIGKKAFSGIYKKAVIKVPAKRLKAYNKKFNKKTGRGPAMKVTK